MTPEFVALVALVGIVSCFFFFARPGRAAKIEPVTIAPTTVTKPIELSPEERLIAEAREAFLEGADARATAYAEHKASLASAQSTVHEADKFVRESGLDVAIPWAWEHMQFWPGWQEMPDRWTPPVALDALSGASRDEVRWTWQGHTFAMLFRKWPSHGFTDDTFEYGTITVESAGGVVAAITARRDFSKDYSRWHFGGVDALKVGPWITDFIRFYQLARLAHESHGYAREAEAVRARAARIDLG